MMQSKGTEAILSSDQTSKTASTVASEAKQQLEQGKPKLALQVWRVNKASKVSNDSEAASKAKQSTKQVSKLASKVTKAGDTQSGMQDR